MLYQIKDTIVWIQIQNVHAWIRTRTVKVRTALSRPCPAIQTDKGKFFFQESGENPEIRQTPDRTWYGPCCRSTSVSNQGTIRDFSFLRKNWKWLIKIFSRIYANVLFAINAQILFISFKWWNTDFISSNPDQNWWNLEISWKFL